MSSNHKPYLIGITGGSGSGKTSFIKALRKRFTESEVCIVSQDHYYKLREEQELDEKGIQNFDLPTSIDQDAFRSDVIKLLNGELISKREYTFNNPAKTAAVITIRSAPVIVLEGLFVYKIDEIREQLDLKIFVHAKDNLKVIRRIIRDRQERNYPLDDVLYRYQHHVLPTFEQYIAPYKDTADIVVNNNDRFDKALEVISGFISHHIKNRP